VGEKNVDGIQPADLVEAMENWLGDKHTGYDFVKVGKIMAAAEAARFIAENLPTAPVFAGRGALHKAALSARGFRGLNLEFGVATGATINFIAKEVAPEQVYGFDSFEGLPDDWTPVYRKGHFAQDLPKVADNVELVVGWFNESLPGFLAEHPGDIAYLHIDCDLYSSTKTIFDLVGDRIRPGSVIVFDEYFNYLTWRDHEHRAFTEFVESRNIGFRYLGTVSRNKQLGVVIESVGGHRE